MKEDENIPQDSMPQDASPEDLLASIAGANPEAEPPPAQTPAVSAPSQTDAVYGKWLQGAKIPGTLFGTTWECTHVGTGESALLVTGLGVDPTDMEAWERLAEEKSELIQKPLDIFVINGRRFEVYAKPEWPPLEEERKNWGPVSPALISSLVKDLVEAIDLLHQKNLVHAHLAPDCIYVSRSGDKVRAKLGRLQGNICCDHTDPIAIQLNAFYAPPEAAGVVKHELGDTIKSWDWWSLGRIIQELAIGRHVVEHMLDHQLDKNSLEDIACAEELLLEKGGRDTRAGGIEVMPPIDKRIDLLLQGLLTGCKDARWGAEEVRRWLAGDSPKERYKLPKNERLFRYKGKSYTIQEAAEVLRTQENWEDANKQIFDRSSPYTLAAFLTDHPSLRPFALKLDDALALSMATDLRASQTPVKNEVILAVALHKLSGGPLYWRGRRLDNASLREMLADVNAVPNRLSCLQAFVCPSVLIPLEKTDYEAFRTLSEGARLAAKAAQKATQAEWLTIAGPGGLPRIWAMAFETPAIWADAKTKLSSIYAACDRKDIQELYTAAMPTAEDALLLAWMLPNADNFGFVTHEVWEQRQHGLLTTKGHTLARQLFWLRLSGTISFGTPWMGNILVVVGLNLLLGLIIALAWPGPEYVIGALAPLCLALSMRIAMGWIIPAVISQHFPDIKWGLFDGAKRCKIESKIPANDKTGARKVLRELREVNERMAKLTHEQPAPMPIPEPPSLHELKLLGFFGWAFLLVPLGFGVYELTKHEDMFVRARLAWTPPQDKDREWLPPEPTTKVDFPFKAPEKPRPLTVVGTESASKEQVDAAQRRGVYYAGNYRPEDMQCCVLVKVYHVRNHAFMIYDPVTRQIVEPTFYFLSATPKRRTFGSVEGRMVFVPDY